MNYWQRVPTAHTLIRTKAFGNLAGYCTCGGWASESVGVDESSRRGFAHSFKAHVEESK